MTLARHDAGYWSLVGQNATYAVVGLLAVVVFMPWRPRLRVACRTFRELTTFGAPVLGSSSADSAARNSVTLILSLFWRRRRSAITSSPIACRHRSASSLTGRSPNYACRSCRVCSTSRRPTVRQSTAPSASPGSSVALPDRHGLTGRASSGHPGRTSLGRQRVAAPDDGRRHDPAGCADHCGADIRVCRSARSADAGHGLDRGLDHRPTAPDSPLRSGACSCGHQPRHLGPPCPLLPVSLEAIQRLLGRRLLQEQVPILLATGVMMAAVSRHSHAAAARIQRASPSGPNLCRRPDLFRGALCLCADPYPRAIFSGVRRDWEGVTSRFTVEAMPRTSIGRTEGTASDRWHGGAMHCIG